MTLTNTGGHVQAVAERPDEICFQGSGRVPEETYPVNLPRLLCACWERPCRRAAEQRDEIAARHVGHGFLPSHTVPPIDPDTRLHFSIAERSPRKTPPASPLVRG
jgi:hypothetical protein